MHYTVENPMASSWVQISIQKALWVEVSLHPVEIFFKNTDRWRKSWPRTSPSLLIFLDHFILRVNTELSHAEKFQICLMHGRKKKKEDIFLEALRLVNIPFEKFLSSYTFSDHCVFLPLMQGYQLFWLHVQTLHACAKHKRLSIKNYWVCPF